MKTTGNIIEDKKQCTNDYFVKWGEKQDALFSYQTILLEINIQIFYQIYQMKILSRSTKQIFLYWDNSFEWKISEIILLFEKRNSDYLCQVSSEWNEMFLLLIYSVNEKIKSKWLLWSLKCQMLFQLMIECEQMRQFHLIFEYLLYFLLEQEHERYSLHFQLHQVDNQLSHELLYQSNQI